MNNSAIRLLDILELLSSSPAAMTATEIAKSLQIPKSSAFDIVKILQERGFIVPAYPGGKSYRLGPTAYRVGMAFINGDGLFSVADPILKRFSNEIGETCYIALEENGKLIYIDKAESDAPIRSSLRVGSTHYLHCTGLGKAILAGYTEEKVRAILRDNMPKQTEATITDIDVLLAELAEIRKRGYSTDLKENNDLLCCVAAPIRDRSGEVIAAVSCTMLSVNYEGEHLNRAISLVKDCALEISHQNGSMDYKLY